MSLSRSLSLTSPVHESARRLTSRRDDESWSSTPTTATIDSPMSASTAMTSPASYVQTPDSPPHGPRIGPPQPQRRRIRPTKLTDEDRVSICQWHRDRPDEKQDLIALRFGVDRSTISKILKNSRRWLGLPPATDLELAAAQARAQEGRSGRRKPPPLPVAMQPPEPGLEMLEEMLKEWAHGQTAASTRITDAAIRREANALAKRLDVKGQAAVALAMPAFVSRFRTRAGIKEGRLEPKTAPYPLPLPATTPAAPAPATAPAAPYSYFAAYAPPHQQQVKQEEGGGDSMARSFSYPGLLAPRQPVPSDVRGGEGAPTSAVVSPMSEKAPKLPRVYSPDASVAYPTPKSIRHYNLARPVYPDGEIEIPPPRVSPTGGLPSSPLTIPRHIDPFDFQPTPPPLLRRATVSAWPLRDGPGCSTTPLIASTPIRPVPARPLHTLADALGALGTVQSFLSYNAAFASPKEASGLNDLLGRVQMAKQYDAEEIAGRMAIDVQGN